MLNVAKNVCSILVSILFLVRPVAFNDRPQFAASPSVLRGGSARSIQLATLKIDLAGLGNDQSIQNPYFQPCTPNWKFV